MVKIKFDHVNHAYWFEDEKPTRPQLTKKDLQELIEEYSLNEEEVELLETEYDIIEE